MTMPHRSDMTRTYTSCRMGCGPAAVQRTASARFSSLRKLVSASCSYFFFQAEDGIRDYKVTGVQTCALPISCAICHERPDACTAITKDVGHDAARDVAARKHDLVARKNREHSSECLSVACV